MRMTIEKAERELALAEQMNPGPWGEHSRNVGRTARLIAAATGKLDPDKAYMVGLLHDIGRRVGIVSLPEHIVEGYRFCMGKGWEEAARVCMTHSYPLMEQELELSLETPEELEIQRYLSGCICDDYDLLIQLCDSLGTDYGFVILEKRFVDVARRYGVIPLMIERWERIFAIKEHFDEMVGGSVYDLLPGIGQNSLLCPPLWSPPEEQA